jgi:hypothetical protein
MDVGSENLFKDRLDARNSKPNSKIEVDQKGRTLYSKRCLTTLETQIVLKELNEGVARRHFATNINTKKILDAGY